MMRSLPGQFVFVRLLCLLCGFIIATASHAAIDILDSIDITHGQGQSTIHMNLSIPVGYKSHVPERSGDFLKIFVEPLPSIGAAENALLGTQTIQWSPTAQVPLFDVTYEGGGFAGTSIILRFQKDVEFSVSETGDFRRIDVVVIHPGTGVPDTTTAPVPDSQYDTAPVPPAGVEAGASPFPYVINLISSVTPIETQGIPDLEEFITHRLYTSTYYKNGTKWYRLRLGFFKEVTDAEAVMQELLTYFPDAWVSKASMSERMRSRDSILFDESPGSTVSTESKEKIIPSVPVVSGSGKTAMALSPERLDALMQEARDFMTEEDYAGAIRLYTKILQSTENTYSQDALEYLGLARERKGQLAHAKMVYREYLERYPDGEGAARVKQRLAGLATASKVPREKLQTAQAGEQPEQKAEWDLFGGISQYYRRDENTTEVADSEVTTVSQSSLDSNVDITGRMRSINYDLRTRFTGGYLYDFLDEGENSDTTVSSMYFDARGIQNGYYMRIGRQSRSSGGVLGRFDGLLLGLPLGNVFSVSAVGGFPVESSSDSFDDTSRYFYGLTLEAEGFATGWDANAFIIEQQADGITDRRAIGGELRYFDTSKSFFSLVDYDINFSELNIWQLLGNWTLPDRSTVNLILDYRQSPILTANNALIGQGVFTFEELQESFSTSEIYDLALDRSATSKLATLGLSRPMSENLQFSGDVTVLNLSGTEASGGVEATESTGTDVVYNAQLIGSSLFAQSDITIFGLRFTDGDDRDVYSLHFNTRFPVITDLRLNPRLRVDSVKNRDDQTSQMIYRPSLRLEYRIKRRLRLDAEIGGEYSDRELVSGSGKDSSYYFSIGYRADF